MAQDRPGGDESGHVVSDLRDVTDLRAAAHEPSTAIGEPGDGAVRWRTDANAALKASEERYRALLEKSGDAVVIVDEQTNVLYASPAVQNLFGRSPEELVGASARKYVHPDDLPMVAAQTREVYCTPGAQLTIEMRTSDASGGWRWIEAFYSNLVDDPRVGGIVVHIRDVTERRDAQDALRVNEERFRSLVEHSGAVAEILDPDGYVTWISDNCFKLVGFRPEEILGKWSGDFAHPDDLEACAEAFSSILDAPGRSVTFESRVRHANGTWRWFECTFTNHLDDPVTPGIIGNFRDVTDRKVAENALRDNERLFRSLARSSPVGIFQRDAAGACVYVNDRWEEITGYTFEQAVGDGWRRIVHPDDAAWLHVDDADRVLVPDLTHVEFRVVRPDGDVRWVSVRTAPMVGDEGQLTGTVGTIEDITDRIDAQRDAQRLIDIFEATNDIVGIADPKGRLLYVNAAARRFFDLPEHGGLDGVDLASRFPPAVAEVLSREAIPALETDGMWSGELAVIRSDGVTIPVLAQLLVHRDGNGEMEFYSGVLHDISERKQFESVLAHQTSHDPLTGLPNRTLLLTRLQDALDRAKRLGLRIAVLFLDLDHFKVVNDSLGHGLGDRLLVAIAQRLKVALRPGDTIARFGGDEFVVLCEDLHGRDDAIAIAERVIAAVSGPFVVDEAEVFVGVSIGIAFPDDDDPDPGNLIRDADAAMYRAKEKGRARWEVFDSAMRASAVDRLDIENALRRALERRELRVYYQPLVSLRRGAIEGVEALLRWEHPERGLLLPGDFITVAEETGLIVPIGAWVLDQACRQVQRWQASHPELPALRLSVNISGGQLGHPKLVDDVADVLAETCIDPAQVELEITESVLMDDVDMSEETLGHLRRLGVKLVVDDFGTGYSSLSYLRRFPVDLLKVDRSFVDGLGTDPSDSAIVTAIITLAHTLGLEAVAEGVETADQLDELRRLGCDQAQGFYFARPASGNDVEELLVTQPRW